MGMKVTSVPDRSRLGFFVLSRMIVIAIVLSRYFSVDENKYVLFDITQKIDETTTPNVSQGCVEMSQL